MGQFRSFEEIEAWQESRVLVTHVHNVCNRESVKRDFAFVDQISRSARSVSANIAEGNDALTVPEFIQFLGHAKRSAAEVRSHLYDAVEHAYISKEEFNSFNAIALKIQRMIAKLIHYLQTLDLKRKRTLKQHTPSLSRQPTNQQTNKPENIQDILKPQQIQKHFTATAFIVDSHMRTLLLWHKRLGRWMPPGGHVDPDETPEECARRECKEETGLDVEILGDAQENLFAGAEHEGRMLAKPIAMLLENIPASSERNEPAHQHMDFLYLARPVDERQAFTLAEEEGSDMRWFTRNEILRLDDRTEIFANVKAYILTVLSDHRG